MKQNLVNIFKYAGNTLLIGLWLLEAVVVIYDLSYILFNVLPQPELQHSGFANLTWFQQSIWLFYTYIVLFTGISVSCLYIALKYVGRDVLIAMFVTMIPMIMNVVTFYFNM